MAGLRTKYRTYVETVMKEAGNPDPKAAADRIIGLETKIAQAHETREESEDFAKGAKVWTRAELEKNAPGIDWAALLMPRSSAASRSSRPITPASIPKLSALVASEPLDAWKDWLVFHTLEPAGDRPAQGDPRRQLRLQRHRAQRRDRSSGRATRWR